MAVSTETQDVSYSKFNTMLRTLTKTKIRTLILGLWFVGQILTILIDPSFLNLSAVFGASFFYNVSAALRYMFILWLVVYYLGKGKESIEKWFFKTISIIAFIVFFLFVPIIDYVTLLIATGIMVFLQPITVFEEFSTTIFDKLQKKVETSKSPIHPGRWILVIAGLSYLLVILLFSFTPQVAQEYQFPYLFGIGMLHFGFIVTTLITSLKHLKMRRRNEETFHFKKIVNLALYGIAILFVIFTAYKDLVSLVWFSEIEGMWGLILPYALVFIGFVKMSDQIEENKNRVIFPHALALLTLSLFSVAVDSMMTPFTAIIPGLGINIENVLSIAMITISLPIVLHHYEI